MQTDRVRTTTETLPHVFTAATFVPSREAVLLQGTGSERTGMTACPTLASKYRRGCRFLYFASASGVAINSCKITLLPAGRKLKFLRNSYQVRQRFGLHLPHHMPALNLHRDFTGSELKGNLLIEHAGNHQAHDLAFPRGQGLVALSKFSALFLLLA